MGAEMPTRISRPGKLCGQRHSHAMFVSGSLSKRDQRERAFSRYGMAGRNTADTAPPRCGAHRPRRGAHRAGAAPASAGDRVAAPAASRRPEPGAGIAPLAGYCVAVASDRRRHPLADLLDRVGARTVNVQAIRSVAQPDEGLLRAATERVLAAGCDEVVVSSGFGLRGWIA